MKTKIIRSVAVMLTVCGGGFAQAQYGQYNYAIQPSAAPVHPSLLAPQTQYEAPQTPYEAPQAQYQAPQVQYQTPQGQYRTAQAPYQLPSAQYQLPQAQYQQPTTPPSYTYQPGSPYKTVGQQIGGYDTIGQPSSAVRPLPAPQQPVIGAAPNPIGHPVAQPVSDSNCSTCNEHPAPAASYGYGNSQPNVYVQAAGAPTCGGACGCPPAAACSAPVCISEPTQIRRFFGSANILFLNRAENYDRALVFDDAAPATTRLRAADADLDFALGYDVTFGTYIGCGQYAISATWMHIDNGDDEVCVTPATAGDYRANFRNLDRVYYDRTGDNLHTDYGVPATDESFYAYMDRAERYHVRRSAKYYGLELMVTGFGIGGAARAGRPSCGNRCNALGNRCNACGNQCGQCNECCPPPRGCGGQCGPMIPACCSKLQMSWSAGLRWFHFEDSFSFRALSERFPAAPAIIDTFTYDVDVENELFGWQIGGKMSYCCGCRTSIYGGLKAGIFANDASLYSRVYSSGQAGRVSNLAYPTYANQDVTLNRSDTVLASLAEIDLGIGYRLAKCWTVRGGYRYLAVSGVATAMDNINDNPANFATANIWVNDSLLLHGGYVGLDYNW